MSNAATSPDLPHRAAWWFAPALLTAVILVVVAVQLVRQNTMSAPAAALCDVTDAQHLHEIPGGAVSVSLCDDPVQPGLSIGVPPDALVEDIDDVIAAYRGLSLDHGNVCTQELGPRFDLVFSYAGGRPVRLSGEYYGCRKIGERYGAGIVLETFLDRLAAQRTHQQPWPRRVAGPACPAQDFRRTYLVPKPETLTEGVVCVVDPGVEPLTFRAITLTGADWAILRADMTENSHPDDPNNAVSGECDRAAYLMATNAFGEQVNVQIHCSGQGWWPPTVRSDPTMRWDLSPASRAIIERLTR